MTSIPQHTTSSLRHILLLIASICALTAAAAGELTVTRITSDAATGITLTFSQDVKVKHSIFGTKCYSTFTDSDAVPSTLNATPRTKGNVVILEAAYCTFVKGHNITLALNPECFTTIDGETQLTGETTFNFVMGGEASADPIVATLVAPSNGTVTRLGCVGVVFAPTITDIVDPSGFTITNENGHSLPILSVTIDDETSIKSLNVNIDPDCNSYQPSTTYSLHIAPRALKCGSITNDHELVYGRWFIRPLPLTLESNPPANRMQYSISSVDVWATDGRALTVAPRLQPSDITVTGIMDDRSTVYAVGKEITYNAEQNGYTITFDRTVSINSIATSTAINSSVKLNIPAGAFTSGEATSEEYQALWIIKRPILVGAVTWAFSPETGSTLDALGTPITVEALEGATMEQYVIQFHITGQNAYLAMNDASSIRIIDDLTGETVMNFGRNDVVFQSVNNYMLLLDHQILQGGTYRLIIPASCVEYYSDSDHYSPPQHPKSDIEATWHVNGTSPTAVSTILPAAVTSPQLYDLQGRRITDPAQSGCYIRNGRKVILTGN